MCVECGKLINCDKLVKRGEKKEDAKTMHKFLMRAYPDLYGLSTHDALLIKDAFLFGWESKIEDLED